MYELPETFIKRFETLIVVLTLSKCWHAITIFELILKMRHVMIIFQFLITEYVFNIFVKKIDKCVLELFI